MAFTPAWLRHVCSILLLVSTVTALKFDLQAQHQKNERCVRNFVAKDTLVVVTATIDGHKGDGMVVNINVRSPDLVRMRACVRDCLLACLLTRRAEKTDQGRRRKRVRSRQGRCRRVAPGLYLARRRRI
jgi:hypothetical protein